MTSSSRVLALMLLAAVPCWLAFVWNSRVSAEAPVGGARGCASRDDRALTISVPSRQKDIPSAGPATDDTSIDAAFEFLKRQMDRYHQSTIVYSADGFGAYYPGGRMGDVNDIGVVPPGERGDDGGHTSVQIDYRPQHSGGMGWAGIYFLYPDGNWGRLPGRNLTGATRLTFWGCADHVTRAEFFVGGIHDPQLPHADSLEKTSTGIVPVTPTWHRYEIDLTGKDVSSVIAGFGMATNRGEDQDARSFFLDDIAFNVSHLDEPHFLPSNLPQGICQVGVLHNSAQVYDQAVVLLAFLARHQPDDLRRAELLARALVEAQHKDRTFKDGRLRNAYAGGELIDPDLGTTRLPGSYDWAARRFVEDENVAGTDTGSMAWAALALVQAHALLPKRAGDPFLQAARSLARWVVVNTKVEDPLGGFSGGVQGFEQVVGVPEGQQRKDYRSTEHNIDLTALFARLAAAASDPEERGHWLPRWPTRAHS